MTTILSRLPISVEDDHVRVGEGWVAVRPYQIIVWVSLSLKTVFELDPATPRFPAILDSGLNHNFAIREGHLTRWAGVRPGSLPSLGTINYSGQEIPLLDANAWIHPNRPGHRDALAGPPVSLELPRGIAVYPADVPNPARIPMLGLRSLIANKLKPIIDGKSRKVTLKTTGWF